jgi:hypothetical protein
MATWFTVVGRVAQIEGISDSNYKNALVEFKEGDRAEEDPSSWRSFYVAFYGALLESGRRYIIFGTGRLTGNEDCTQPNVRFLTLPPTMVPHHPVVYSFYSGESYSAHWNWPLIVYLVYCDRCHPLRFS